MTSPRRSRGTRQPRPRAGDRSESRSRADRATFRGGAAGPGARARAGFDSGTLHLSNRQRLYARLPWLFAPASSRRRLALVAAGDRKGDSRPRARVRFAAWQLKTALRASVMLGRMAGAARNSIATVDLHARPRVPAPRLVVTGDPGLDLCRCAALTRVRAIDCRARGCRRSSAPAISVA